jgi:hypothetical protein
MTASDLVGKGETAIETAANVTEGVKREFTGVYLALITIVQGITLASIAQSAAGAFGHYTGFQWFAAVNIFVAILATWQEYMIGALVFSWLPTIVDTAVPFVLGLAEFALIEMIDKNSPKGYFLVLPVGWLLALAASINLQVHACRGDENRRRRALLARHMRWNIGFCVLGVAWATLLAIALFTLPVHHASLLAALSCVPTALLLGRMPLHFNRAIRMAGRHGALSDVSRVGRGG